MNSYLRYISDLSKSFERVVAPPKTILLTAASGNIGRVLAPLLLTQDPSPKLVLPTINIEKLIIDDPGIVKCNDPNVVLREGSIRDPMWFEQLLVKYEVEAVFLCLNGIDEMFNAIQCLDAMSKVRTVQRVVYLSIMGDFPSPSGMAEVYRDRSYPHIFSKVGIEQKLKHAGYSFDWTILGSSVFFANDLRLKAPIMDTDFYPEPSLEKARNLLLDTSGQWHEKQVMIGSKHRHTTSEAARLWPKALGRPIHTQSGSVASLDQFEQKMREIMGPGIEGLAWARDMRLLYEYHIQHGDHINNVEYQTQVQLLGKEPDDDDAWIEKTAALWK